MLKPGIPWREGITQAHTAATCCYWGCHSIRGIVPLGSCIRTGVLIWVLLKMDPDKGLWCRFFIWEEIPGSHGETGGKCRGNERSPEREHERAGYQHRVTGVRAAVALLRMQAEGTSELTPK